MWRRIAGAAALLGLAATLSACRDGGVAVPTPAAIPTLGPLDPAALVWALGSAPGSLDPANLTTDPAGQQVAAQIYDRLVRFRPGTVQLAPGLAANWEADPDGKAFTFILRDGLRFHDDTPLDAAAVAWNFQRWLDPQHPQHHGDFRAWRDLFGGFAGEKDAQGRDLGLVSRVEAVDARTLRITLNRSFAPFLQHLALIPFGIASPAAVQAQGEAYGADGNHLPVGSGPFRMVAWLPDGTVRLERFDGYWGQPAKAPAIQFTVISDPERRAAAVVAGQVHGAELPATMPVTGTLASEAVSVLSRPSRANSWLVLNHGKEPFNDLRVRQAIDLAIDRDKLARRHFGPRAVPANQLMPPGFLGHDDTLPPARYDPEAAKVLLAEAGVGDGFDLNLWVPTSARGYLPDPVATASTVAEMLQAVGIRAKVRSASMRRFLSDRDRGRYTAWLLGWEAQSGDPDSLWYWHFSLVRQPSEGQYQNAELAKLLVEAQVKLSSGPRVALYEQAARLVAKDTPRVFLVHAVPIVALSRRVRRFEPSPLGYDDFAPVSLPPASDDATAVPVPTGDAPTPTAVPAATADATGTAGTPGPPGTAGPAGTPAMPDAATSAASASAPATPVR